MTESTPLFNDKQGRAGGGYVPEKGLDRRFAPLEAQMDMLPSLSERMAKKHWHQVEREKYPFWIGILILALLGIAGRLSPREGGIIVILMLIGLGVVLFIHIRSFQGRFLRIWEAISGDGELFRFLRDSSIALGYPVELSSPESSFSTHLEVDFPDAVKAVESYLQAASLPDPFPIDAPPVLRLVPPAFKDTPGSESHRVYELEYRGNNVSRSLTIKVAKSDSGSEVVIGYPVRSLNAESRERLALAILGCLQDRLIAAKILADIRDFAGVPPVPVPTLEVPVFAETKPVSRTI